MRKLTATLVLVGALVLGLTAPAGAATKTVALSVRLSGSTLVVNVSGVAHSCTAAGSRQLPGRQPYGGTRTVAHSSAHYSCTNGTSFNYQQAAGASFWSLNVTVGTHRRYTCHNPSVTTRPQWTCKALVVQ